MSTLITQVRIESYKKAYYDCHGEWPLITKHGAWIKINRGPSAFRSSDLPRMTLNLMDMTIRNKRKEEENKRIQKAKTRTPKWKEISEETIDLFMNKLFETCEHSLYKMERCMMNLACNNFKSDGLKEDWEDGCVDCDTIDRLEREMREEAEYFHEQINELQSERNELQSERNELQSERNELRERNERLMEANTHLKENSVFFSMEDFAPAPIDCIHEDDDIPF